MSKTSRTNQEQIFSRHHGSLKMFQHPLGCAQRPGSAPVPHTRRSAQAGGVAESKWQARRGVHASSTAHELQARGETEGLANVVASLSQDVLRVQQSRDWLHMPTTFFLCQYCTKTKLPLRIASYSPSLIPCLINYKDKRSSPTSDR